MTTATIIDTYLLAYGEPEETQRRTLIASCFTPDATLADPPLEGAGHDGLNELFATVQQHFPAHTFARTSDVDEHHGTARYEWELRSTEGVVAVAGTDFVTFAGDGKIRSVVGFFGPIPPR